MRKYFICIWITLFALTGCGDFLEEQSKDLTYATSCADLEELLIGGGYMKQVVSQKNRPLVSKTSAYFPWIHMMDDDLEESIAGAPGTETELREQFKSFYRWEKDPFNVNSVFHEDVTWSQLYAHIAVLNVVLDKADEFTADEEDARRSVKGQSYFLRAGYYFLLVNFYGKPYDITASTDPGVPLKLTSFVQKENWARTSVGGVYEQIVSDLKAAIDHLSGLPVKSFYRANESAARSLLSRVYCHMGKWDLVPALCDSVLDKSYGLLDLIPMKFVKDAQGWVGPKSPEIIFTQGPYFGNRLSYDGFNSMTTVSGFQISETLKELFVEGDRRREFLYDSSRTANKNVIYPQKIRGKESNNLDYVSDVFLLRLAEVYLNKAEALVMTGKEGEAREVLRELMVKRFKPAALPTITESGKALIDLVRQERRRELCFEGHRWFDLRRYAVSPKYPDAKSIRHNSYEYTSGNKDRLGEIVGYYELLAYPDGGWVLPIPSYEIQQNEGTMVNNERESCMLINI